MSGIKVANRQGVSKQIGDRLKQLRDSLNHDRNQMADRLGITVSSYSRYEGGTMLPGLNILIMLARRLDLSLDWLITGKGPMFYREREAAAKEEPGSGLLDQPDVLEMLNHMAQLPLFRHEILSFFYKLKSQHREPTAPVAELDSSSPPAEKG
jgi:transcriptional regulator with XRE-family HTH domain